MNIISALSITILCTLRIWAQPNSNIIYSSDELVIEQIAQNLYKHISTIEIPGSGKFPCNGVIYFSEGEAVILDTSVGDKASIELINWIQDLQEHQIRGVIVNHYHDDCLGGLNVFHSRNIPSYANKHTIILAREHGNPVPQNGFSGSFDLEVGNTEVVTSFIGEGHTSDNVVSYLPKVNALFGGCLIKALKADKGNLNDANLEQWPVTVEEIIRLYPEVQIVIPGHGKEGGKELLDYTIQLFEFTTRE
ncbi:subclass B1 metallo-beta-lactamase [Robertkochia marina]|uniref:beta-lactamase n=1 Tax=Robertkochia marina TaxID=1227945 RepID=A0A4S3M3T5_9FLAO|nr:subclass B1 metallo-beta-lactamase [Robertkochia marina]THD69796.1 subclass B1 metallo-beta-lactamase [Robertkochia marina]TRZ46860.1 subclass B1 metallo-beta-lactamase [Robertkochia marina]